MSQGFTQPLPIPVPISKGGTGLTATTINQLLYSSAANTIAGLATGNSSVLVTSAGGVPSLSTALPSGLTATNMSLTTPTLGAATATSLTFSPTTGGIVGTTTNNNVAAGSVGEFQDSGIVTSTFAVSTTVYNTTSLSLTAGDWDVYGSLYMSPVSFNVNNVSGGISTTSATPPATGGQGYFFLAIPGGGGISGLGVTTLKCFSRISLASTTTVYLCAAAQWAGSAPTYLVSLVARRVR
jgi:hypothetical protein